MQAVEGPGQALGQGLARSYRRERPDRPRSPANGKGHKGTNNLSMVEQGTMW